MDDRTIKREPILAAVQRTAIERGRSVKLPADVSPADATDKKIKYATENKSVATVSSSGTISGKGAGTEGGRHAGRRHYS